DIKAEEAAKRERDSYVSAQQAFSKGGLNQTQVEELLKQETERVVAGEQAAEGLLSPEQRGTIRALREYEAAYVQQRAKAAGDIQVTGGNGQVVQGKDVALAREDHLTEAQRAIAIEAREGSIRDSYQNLRTFEDRRRFFEANKGHLDPKWAEY